MSYRTRGGVATGTGGGRRHRADEEEMHAAIRRALGWGYSDLRTALYANCSDRTVFRYRKRYGIPTNYPKRSSE